MTPSERITALKNALEKAPAPSLRRVNGIGNLVGGRYYDPAIAPFFIIACVPTGLFVPISRGQLYLVQEGPADVYRFYGKIPWDVFERIYPDGLTTVQKGTGSEAALSFVIAVVAIVVMAFVLAGLQQLFRHH